jgi:large subunit ribosomal protein L21
MYAIIKTGGKQYRVEKDEKLIVERIEGEPGTSVELGEVLMVRTDAGMKIGTPLVVGAKVMGKILRQDRGPKIQGYTYKAKKNVRHHYGHRQEVTHIQVTDILEG